MANLRDLAQQLIEARAKAAQGQWSFSIDVISAGHDIVILDECMSSDDAEFITLAANHAVEVIEGYQRLLKHYVNIWINRTSGQLMESELYKLSEEMRESIPE